jgi:anti-sigma factor RsiW
MSCENKGPLIHALADGELDLVHASEVESHIAQCADCAATYAGILAMKQRLRQPGLQMRAPVSLLQRIEEAIPKPAAVPESVPALRENGRVVSLAEVAERKQRKSWVLRAQGALAGAAGTLAVAATIALFVVRASSGDEIARGLIDSHLRSLAGEHLYDVQSTDQHTVKPWFAGKLDITPPVPDLALKGFTLVGGRLDYIGGRAAAVVVYRRRIHVINLYVWRGSDLEPPRVELSGYFLRHWTKDGLVFWAVSDLNEAELAEFEADYRAES